MSDSGFERVIMITGGAGFIASHVVIHFVKTYPQYKVVNFDKLDYCSCLRNLSEIAGAPNYVFVKGDIGSSDLVNYVLKVEKVDTILHFAAQTHVDNSFGNSIQFTETNVLGTHVLLEAAKMARLRLFVHVSTDEVYGEGEVGGSASHEGSLLEPTNPYAASKAGAEYLVKAYHRSFSLPTIITRSNNIYGPHQYPEKIIPKFINQLMRGKKITIHGTGTNTRNYLYVADVTRAFDLIFHKGIVGEVYNIGSSTELSNMTVARDLLRLMGKAGTGTTEEVDKAIEEHVVYVRDRLFNDLRYPLDCKKLVDMGWGELTTWSEGLDLTLQWYLRFSTNWEDVEAALVAHPRRGLLPSQLTAAAATEEPPVGSPLEGSD